VAGDEAQAMILCWLGWHKVRHLDMGTFRVEQGCDRCGKRRILRRNSYGRTIEVTPWT
jgi:hypothetical protein